MCLPKKEKTGNLDGERRSIKKNQIETPKLRNTRFEILKVSEQNVGLDRL